MKKLFHRLQCLQGCVFQSSPLGVAEQRLHGSSKIDHRMLACGKKGLDKFFCFLIAIFNLNCGACIFQQGNIPVFLEFQVGGPGCINRHAKPCAGFLYGGQLLPITIGAKLYLGQQDAIGDLAQFRAVFQTGSPIFNVIQYMMNSVYHF